MNPHFHECVSRTGLSERQGIVVILGIGRVYGKGGNIPEIHPLLDFPGEHFLLQRLRFFFHLFFKPVGKSEFGQNGVHFSSVLSGIAQHVNNFSYR